MKLSPGEKVLSYIHLYVLKLDLAVGKIFMIFTLLVSSYSMANSQATSSVINQIGSEINQQIRLQQETEKSLLPKSEPKQTFQFDVIESKVISSDGPCFIINKTIFSDDSKLLPTPLDYTKLNGQCANKKALIDLLESINIYYQQQGLITTRVYLQPQNLKNGELKLIAKAGVLESFNYLSGKPVDSKLTSAYPFSINELISLRDLEQGLENLNRLKSQSAKIELLAGKQLWQSQLAVDITSTKPWRIGFGVNNYGVKSTGTRKATIVLGYDNLLNLNCISSDLI